MEDDRYYNISFKFPKTLIDDEMGNNITIKNGCKSKYNQ